MVCVKHGCAKILGFSLTLFQPPAQDNIPARNKKQREITYTHMHATHTFTETGYVNTFLLCSLFMYSKMYFKINRILVNCFCSLSTVVMIGFHSLCFCLSDVGWDSFSLKHLKAPNESVWTLRSRKRRKISMKRLLAV